MVSINANKNPPADWVQRGVIYTDSHSQSYIVCHSCQMPANKRFFDGYIAEDATSFWKHIEVNHLNDYDEQLQKKSAKRTISRPTTPKKCTEATQKITKLFETIVIDDDDDDDEEEILSKTDDENPSVVKNLATNSNADEIEKELSRICGEIENDCTSLLNNRDTILEQNNQIKCENVVMPYAYIPTPEASPVDEHSGSLEKTQSAYNWPAPQNNYLANNSTPNIEGNHNVMSLRVLQSDDDGKKNKTNNSIKNPTVTSQGDLKIRISWNSDTDLLQKGTQGSPSSHQTGNLQTFQNMNHSNLTQQSAIQNSSENSQNVHFPTGNDYTPSPQYTSQSSNYSNRTQVRQSPQRMNFSNASQYSPSSQRMNFSNRTQEQPSSQNEQFSNGTEHLPSSQSSSQNLNHPNYVQTYRDYRSQKSNLQKQSPQNNYHRQMSQPNVVQRQNFEINTNYQNARNSFCQHEIVQSSSYYDRSHIITNTWTPSSINDVNNFPSTSNELVERQTERETTIPKINKRRQSYVMRPYKCSKCWVRCNTEESKEIHEAKFHNGNNMKFECTFCKKHIHMSSYRKHLKKHFLRQL